MKKASHLQAAEVWFTVYDRLGFDAAEKFMWQCLFFAAEKGEI